VAHVSARSQRSQAGCLIVDDESSMRAAERRLMQAEGFEGVEAS
jgi:hypothetical protein